MYCSCPEQYFFFLWSHIEKEIFRPVISRPESAEKSSLDVPDNTIWSARKERRIHSLNEHLFTRYLYNLAHFWNPFREFIVHWRGADITGNVSDGRAGGGWGAQMRAMRIGMVGDSVLCWGECWDNTWSTIVCLDMCFIRYVSWERQEKNTFRLSAAVNLDFKT